jgi:uncharacterized protein YndB with AHSA1/START domain
MSVGEGIVIQESIDVAIDPQRAFDLWTDGINRWWRRGTYYWNDSERARGLRFEPWVGGRLIEIYDEATGEGFEIGRVTIWEPGRRLGYTWRQADWPSGEQAEAELSFDPIDDGTRVTLLFRGWERITRGDEIARGYSMGAKELFGWYAETAASLSA